VSTLRQIGKAALAVAAMMAFATAVMWVVMG
jgi:hypothetical protein